MAKKVLLLTGTIAPHQGVSNIGYKSASLDPRSRLREYVTAICYYLSQSVFDEIVFCENSNYECEKELNLIQDFAFFYEKKIEILQFEGNHQMTLDKGYGYGEGECLDYAFDHSHILKNADSRYKLTGRYIYTNINEIVQSSEKMENLFFRRMWPLAYFCLSSAFFKVNRNVYQKYLYNIKERLDHTMTIEAAFYKALRESNIDLGKLKYIPQRVGSNSVLETKRYHRLFLKLKMRDMNTKIGKILDILFYKRG